MEGLTISCIIGMYLNFLVQRFCLLTVNRKGGHLPVEVHKFAQLQGVYVAGKIRSQVESVFTGLIGDPHFT